MSAKDDSAERVYKAAKELFAHKGYDGTSIRDIARAVNLNVATVQYHIGSKEALYKEVLRRIYEKEYLSYANVIQQAQAQMDRITLEGLRDVMKGLGRTYIQNTLDDPDTSRIWVYRYLEESDRFSDMDVQFSLPLYDLVLDLMKKGRDAGFFEYDDKRLRLLIVAYVWLAMGHFYGRKNDWGNPKYNSFDPLELDLLRDLLDRYIDRMVFGLVH